ncbi:hypothetical protein TL16_g02509 [Triparma laevis f. inornata]|uniref:Coproporphyrinogen oxidase n=1 Tax=Triparma laevis f. inornata TaxID=1714386 RepID=A0A9W7DX05_9STRA|nr:hypothetical protein TL16_g02509 [Triparma laevis f. inornata]
MVRSSLITLILLLNPLVTSFRPHIPPQTPPTKLRSSASATAFSVDDAFHNFVTMIERVQQDIIASIEERETAKFSDDPWSTNLSQGRTRVIEGGSIIEKGAVSVSVVERSTLSPARAETISARGIEVKEGAEYCAAALSLVLHTRSPLIPTFRSDIRVFCLKEAAWVGGGADLTPYYLFDEDVKEFHGKYKDLCERHGQNYEEYKKVCDDYFYIPARKEHRGVGGIFFDDLPLTPVSFSFVEQLAELWMPSWLDTICDKRMNDEYTEAQVSTKKRSTGSTPTDSASTCANEAS